MKNARASPPPRFHLFAIPSLLSLTLFLAFALNSVVTAPPTVAASPCVGGFIVSNTTSAPATVTVSGDGTYVVKRVEPGERREIRAKGSNCLTLSVTGRIGTSGVAPRRSGATATGSAAHDYAARLKAGNQVDYDAQPDASPTARTADARELAEGAARSSAASHEAERARQAAAHSSTSDAQQQEHPQEEVPQEELPEEEHQEPQENQQEQTQQSESHQEPPHPHEDQSYPATTIPVPDVAYGKPVEHTNQPTDPAVQKQPYPGGLSFSERKVYCSGGSFLFGAPVTLLPGIQVTPVPAECGAPPPETEDDDDDDSPRDVGGEDDWLAFLKELQKQKEEEDKKLKDELDEIEEKLEEEKERRERERERRRNHPEREKNRIEKERLEEERDRLEREADELEEEQDRIEKTDEDLEERDKSLREEEQKARRNDPNCRGAECQRIRSEREQVQRDKVTNMKDGQQLERDARKFRNDLKDYNDARDAYEERLDQGKGLERSEWRARMMRKEADAAREEADRIRSRYSDLSDKKNNKKPMTEDEVRELRNIEKFLDNMEQEYRDKYGEEPISGGWSGLEMKVRALELNAGDAAKEAHDKLGGTYEDWSDFFENAEAYQGREPPFSARGFSELSNDDLKEQEARLDKALDRVRDAKARVGRAGEAPPNAHEGLDRLAKTKGEIDELGEHLSELNAARNRAINEHNELEKKLKGDPSNRRERSLEERLEDAKRRGDRDKIRDLEKQKRDIEREMRAKLREARVLGRHFDEEKDALRDKIHDYNFDRYDALADNAQNAVNSYNRSLGDAVDADGNINPVGLRRHVDAFERNAGEIGRQTARGNTFRKLANDLESTDGKPTATGRRLGLSEKEVRGHVADLRRKEGDARGKRDAALEALKRDGFEAELSDDNELEIKKVPAWAGLYAGAAREVLGDEAGKVVRRVPWPEGMPRDPPPMERVRLEKAPGPEGADINVAMGAGREEAAVADGAPKPRPAVPVETAGERRRRMPELRERMEQEERQAQARRDAYERGGFEEWRRVRVDQREEKIEKLEEVKERTERETAELINLQEQQKKEVDHLEAEAQRKKRMEDLWLAWYEEVQRGRGDFEGAEETRRIREELPPRIRPAAEEVEEARPAPRAADLTDIPKPEVGWNEAERLSRPALPPDQRRERESRYPEAGDDGPARRAEASGDTKTVSEPPGVPQPETGEDPPVDIPRARVGTGDPPAVDEVERIEARAAFREWSRETLKAYLERDPAAARMLPEIILGIADRIGAENASKLVLEALNKLPENPRAIDFLDKLFDQATLRAEALAKEGLSAEALAKAGEEAKHATQLAHLQLIDALLSDDKLKVAWGIEGAGVEKLNRKREALRGGLIESLNEAARAADRAGQPAAELAHLAALLNLQREDASARREILNRVEFLQKRLLDRAEISDANAALTAGAALAGSLEILLGAEKDADRQRELLERLKQSYELQRRAAAQLANGAEGEVKEAFRREAFGAGLKEARAVLGLNDVAGAIALLRGLEANGSEELAARAQILLPALNVAERVYEALTEEERRKLGPLDWLKRERRNVLRDWFRNEENPQMIAALGVRLAGEQTNDAEALFVLNQALERVPGHPFLLSKRLEIQAIEHAGGEVSRDKLKEFFEAIPESERGVAIVLALEGIAARSTPEFLDELKKAVEASDLDETAKRNVEIQWRLAKIDALRRRPSTANDHEIEKLLEEGKKLVDALPAEAVTAKEAFGAAFSEVVAGREKLKDWRKAIDEMKPPAEGFVNVARQALEAGRFDLASDAVSAELQRLEQEGNWEDIQRQYTEIIRVMQLVSSRVGQEGVTDDQKKVAQDFLDRVGGMLDRRIASTLEGFDVSARNAKKVAWESEKQLEEGNITENMLQSRRESYQTVLNNARAFQRLRLLAEAAKLPAAERDNFFVRKQNEVKNQIRAYEAEIKEAFDKSGEDVNEGRLRDHLERALGHLDYLRALQDAAIDARIALAGNTKTSRRIGIDEHHKTLLEWELHEIDVELNGSSRSREPSYGVRGRLRGAEGWRQFSQLIGDDDDRHRDVIMIRNEIEYLERRRASLVMENPFLSVAEKRTLYAETLKREADRWKAMGEGVSPLLLPELTGIGSAEIARAEAQYREIEAFNLRNLESDYEAAKEANDPQKAFRALVGLREAWLSGEIDKYVSYLGVPWYERGPVRGIRIGLWGEETGEALNELSADMGKLHSALIQASYRPVGQLDESVRGFLEERGFIQNGRYVLPEGIQLREKTAATELADEGKLGVIDRYVNAAFAAELAVTVALPGGISARAASGAFGRYALGKFIAEEGAEFTTREIARTLLTRAGARYLAGRTAAFAGERAIEAALFTGLSRGARTLLHPEMILDEKQWSLEALGGEYLHNLAVLSALRVAGGSMNTAREGLRTALGKSLERPVAAAVFRAASGGVILGSEAALLTGLQSLFQKNVISQEDFIGNLLTVGMLKAFHPAVAEGRGEVGQTARVTERYNQWLDGRYLPLRPLLERYSGSWEAMRKAYQNKEFSGDRMQELFNLRKKVIDELAADIVRELGGGVQAFGSTKLTSDYDLSFYGPKAELAVMIFNARFGARWKQAMEIGGGESASRLDVNFYTNPVFDAFKGGPNDVARQDGFAHMAARKYLTNAQWSKYKQELLRNTPEAERGPLRDQLREIEKSVLEANGRIGELEREIARERGLEPSHEDVAWGARNRLYEESLRDIIRLKSEYENAATPEQKAAIAQQIRDAQSNALYYAAEAYQTNAAIKHVVGTIQAAGRSITVESLLSEGKLELSIPLSEAQGRQSFYEQYANALKEYNHGGDNFKLTGKVAKYFLRALDAAKIGGLNLKDFEALVKRTVEVETNRSDVDALKEIFKTEAAARQYMRDVQQALETLGGRLAARAHSERGPPSASPDAAPAVARRAKEGQTEADKLALETLKRLEVSGKEAEAAQRQRDAEIASRQAQAPEFALPEGTSPPASRGFVPTREIVAGNKRYLNLVMTRAHVDVRPTQNKVYEGSINRYVRDMLSENFRWENILEGDQIVLARPTAENGHYTINHGHHRIIAAQIVAKLTGKPLFGPGGVIPDAAIKFVNTPRDAPRSWEDGVGVLQGFKP